MWAEKEKERGLEKRKKHFLFLKVLTIADYYLNSN
jgi:hypothetical protein